MQSLNLREERINVPQALNKFSINLLKQTLWTGIVSTILLNKTSASFNLCTTQYASHIDSLNAELNPICYLLALLGAHHFLHVSRIRVKSLTLRLLMSYIYIWSLRLLTCWQHGFESHRGHGYLSGVSVMCCQVEVSATSWSLVQRSPTNCGASLCVI